ncbi:glycosyltransferase family 2 protein [Litorimonas sp. WD9-15]|uniref:glycosyltransferase family 2 protein n=1 Tax=Litorimonas sp. WD9-15 TaxID=3418716 RepID=UPI003D05D4BE
MADIVALPIDCSDQISSDAARKRPISVVMVSYMTGPALMESILAVLADRDIHELIVVDNGNTEPSRARLSELTANRHRVSFIQGHGNIGFARACNYGARMATGHYILFLNPDAIIAKGSARELANAGDCLVQPWITGGLLRDIEGKEQRGGRRAALTPTSALVGFLPFLEKLPGLRSVHREGDPMPDAPIQIETVSGACLMTDRPSFDKMGGFDESYFLHVEDIEICRRARQMGGQVGFVPGATVMHYGSTSNVPRIWIEGEKLKGFLRYFWNYTPGPMSKILTVLAAPFMATAIMGRAYILTLKAALFGANPRKAPPAK